MATVTKIDEGMLILSTVNEVVRALMHEKPQGQQLIIIEVTSIVQVQRRKIHKEAFCQTIVRFSDIQTG